MNSESPITHKPRIRAKLIVNPSAGTAEESPVQLMDLINELQAWKIVPETYLVTPDSDLVPIVQDALQRGIRLFVVSGGDGTIENVAGTLVGTRATLGIIPTGTRNNVALSLNIPENISSAVALLRNGRRTKMDVGFATCGEFSRFFLETCSVGLFAALFPSTDDIQHGNLARISDFLATLITSPSAAIRLVMNEQEEIITQGHVVLVANLPYVGPHCQVAPEDSFHDGFLDVLVFPEVSKLELLSKVTQLSGCWTEDPNVQHYHVQSVDIDTKPFMPVMADGFSLGEGPLHIGVQRCALTVMAGDPASTAEMDKPSSSEELPCH